MNSCIVGIDPGVSGAIAVVIDRSVSVTDMPTVEVRGKRLVDAHGLAAELFRLGEIMAPIEHVVVEHVQGVQGAGATSSFAFGRGFGIIEGVLAGLGLPYTLVRPQVWTRDLGVSRDKGEHRRAAMRLYPQASIRRLFSRAKDDGRADAALIAHWYVRSGTLKPQENKDKTHVMHESA